MEFEAEDEDEDERAEEGAEVGRLRMVKAGPGVRACGGGSRDVDEDATEAEDGRMV